MGLSYQKPPSSREVPRRGGGSLSSSFIAPSGLTPSVSFADSSLEEGAFKVSSKKLRQQALSEKKKHPPKVGLGGRSESPPKCLRIDA